MTVPKTMNRRSFLKVSAGLMGAGMLASAYPVFGERFWYEIKEIHLSISNLPEAFKGWRIVQFSDVHFGFYFGKDELRRVCNIIEELSPDILFFTGDLVQRGYQSPEVMVPFLKKLKAQGGKWAVMGNHDYPTKAKVVRALQSADFRVLENDHGVIPYKNQYLYVAGLDDALSGKPKIEKAMESLSWEDCVLMLVHEPDLAGLSEKYKINAQFSGHSHGGQVKLPYFGTVFSPELAQQYVEGLYFVGDRKMPVYVNRGIGTSTLPIRFLCRPEITVLHLN